MASGVGGRRVGADAGRSEPRTRARNAARTVAGELAVLVGVVVVAEDRGRVGDDLGRAREVRGGDEVGVGLRSPRLVAAARSGRASRRAGTPRATGPVAGPAAAHESTHAAHAVELARRGARCRRSARRAPRARRSPASPQAAAWQPQGSAPNDLAGHDHRHGTRRALARRRGRRASGEEAGDVVEERAVGANTWRSPVQPSRSSRCGQSVGTSTKLPRMPHTTFAWSWFSELGRSSRTSPCARSRCARRRRRRSAGSTAPGQPSTSA